MIYYDKMGRISELSNHLLYGFNFTGRYINGFKIGFWTIIDCSLKLTHKEFYL
jgi:hypothetical protein